MFKRQRLDDLIERERERPTVTIPDTSPRLWRDDRSVWVQPDSSHGWCYDGVVNVSLCREIRIRTVRDVWCNPRYVGSELIADDHVIACGSFEHVQREYERLLDFMESR